MGTLPVFICESILLGVGLAMDAFSISMANGLQDPQMSRKRMGIIAGAFAWFQFLMPMVGWVCVHTISERFTAFQKAVPWIAFFLLVGIGGKMLLEGGRSDGNGQGGQEGGQVSGRKAGSGTGAVFGGETCPDAGEKTASDGGEPCPDASRKTASGGREACPDAGEKTASDGREPCPDASRKTASGGREPCPDASGKTVSEEKKTPETGRLTGAVLLLQAVATSIDALSVGFTIAMYSALEAFAASALIAVTTFVICLGGIRIGRHFGLRLADRASILGGTILVLIGCRILFGGGF